jgi:molecular chaperone GrpE
MNDENIETVDVDTTDAGGVDDLAGLADLAGTDAVEQAEEVVEHDIEALLSERDQFKDIALRLQADFDNFRKRMVDRAAGRLAEALLPVLDACEAAFTHGVAGVEPIWSALIGALQKQGLEAMDLEDKAFDPNHAEAVMHEEGDSEHPVVSEVLRTGYLWRGKVLRAAMVKVRG